MNYDRGMEMFIFTVGLAFTIVVIAVFLNWLVNIGVRHQYRKYAPDLDEWKQQHRSKVRRRK